MVKSWDNANYPKRQEIQIQSAYIDSNLTNFPVLVVITDSEGIVAADCASKRYEVYDHNGTKLSWEQDSYSEGTYVNAEIWVKVPTLYASPSGDQNKVWLYYGYDPGSDQDDPTGTWNANFGAVYHFNDLNDSTSNARNLSEISGSSISFGTGKIGNCAEFDDGTPDGAYVDDAFDTAAGFAWSVWAQSNDTGINQAICGLFDASASTEYWLSYFRDLPDQDICCGAYDSPTAGYLYSTGGWSTNTWHHIAFREITSSSRKSYLDFTDTDTDTTAVTPDNIDTFSVGYRRWGGSAIPLSGKVDELRCYVADPGEAWLKFEHYNMANADHEQTWGGEETGGHAGPLVNSIRLNSKLKGLAA